MKNIKYILFAIIFLSLNIFNVKASCTEEELSNLKLEADKIKITYKHMGKVEYEEYTAYNIFEVTVKNLHNDLYINITELEENIKIYPINGEGKTKIYNGNWNFYVYSNKCNTKIDTIKVFIPRFNTYSLDPLCEGIDGEDFPLCGKYYEYDISYASFKDRVTHYRNTHNIDNKNTIDNENNDKIILKELLNYITKYRIYIIIPLTFLLIILIAIIIINKRKKRGVLK